MRCRVVQLLAGAAMAAAAGAAFPGGQSTADGAAEKPADRLGLSASVSLDNSGNGPDGRLRGGVRLDYRLPALAQGDTLDLYGGYNQTDYGWRDRAWPEGGKGAMLGARYSQLLAKGDGHESRLNFGAGIKAFRADGWQQDSEPGNDVTVHPLSLNYSGNWLFDRGEVNGSVTVLRNLAGGPRGGQDDFTRARPGAEAGYSIVRLAASLTRQLPRDFQVRAAVNGQYTRDALVPGEQVGVGGGAQVRGFSARDLANDSGLTANVELYSPQLCGTARWQCRALVFYDKGLVKLNREQNGELRTKSIGSVGVGIRVNISRDVDMQVDYGHVLRSSQMPQQDKNRLHVRVDLSW
jgi:hemolysin activation/secretion protein